VHCRLTPGPHLGHGGVADQQGFGACRARPARAGQCGCLQSAALIDCLRADIGRVEEPQFKAIFETAAEVLGGLVTAFRHYEKK
jgi:hypothetical protein